MLEYVLVKVQSLVDETKFIRRMEKKTKWQARNAKEHQESADAERFLKANNGLHLHRVVDVRKEARVAHLVYGFLKGKKYREMEPLAYDQPNWDRIEKLIMRYGEEDPRILAQKFAEWKAEALGRVKANYQKSIQPGSHRGRWTEWMHESRLQQSAKALPQAAE